MLHELDRVAYRVGRMAVERVDDDAGLRTFYLVDLDRLSFDRKVPMQYADAAFARERYREASLGDGVHSRAAYRDIEVYLRRQLRRHIDAGGHHLAVSGDKKHVVKGKAAIINKFPAVLLHNHMSSIRLFNKNPGAPRLPEARARS